MYLLKLDRDTRSMVTSRGSLASMVMQRESRAMAMEKEPSLLSLLYPLMPATMTSASICLAAFTTASEQLIPACTSSMLTLEVTSGRLASSVLYISSTVVWETNSVANQMCTLSPFCTIRRSSAKADCAPSEWSVASTHVRDFASLNVVVFTSMMEVSQARRDSSFVFPTMCPEFVFPSTLAPPSRKLCISIWLPSAVTP
mmetsp:Transcript_35858/g.60435  ORF Transcript_35858/g.60435 Transcript_35858/m.60435 type:complete len:200 (-) Transcript_35858:648-1247(-)